MSDIKEPVFFAGYLHCVIKTRFTPEGTMEWLVFRHGHMIGQFQSLNRARAFIRSIDPQR